MREGGGRPAQWGVCGGHKGRTCFHLWPSGADDRALTSGDSLEALLSRLHLGVGWNWA